jgi:hypothetical protein
LRREGGWRRAPTRGDFAVLLLLIAALPLATLLGRPRATSTVLLVQLGSLPAQRYDVRRDRDVTLDGAVGRSVLRIRDGAAWIETAPCHDRVCQKLGRLHGPGRALVCVPNRLIVRFDSAGGSVDAVTR